MTVLGIAIADKCRAAPAAPIAEVTARCLDTIEFTSLLNEWRCGYQYGPSSRTADALAALIEHITEWADRRPAGEHPGRAGLSEIIAESKEVSKGLTSIMADLTASERAKPEPVKATSEKLAAISNDSSFVEHAKLAEGPSERERKQLADWLLRNPVDGGKLKFAGPPEAFGLGLSQVKMMDGEGNEWTLIAGLREGYKTEAERNTTLLRVVKEEFAAEAGQQAGAVDGGDHADNP